MASASEVPRDLNEALRLLNRRLTTVERRRPGDGVNIDGQCEFGGGAGGDGGYYQGGTDFPNTDFPDSSYPDYLNDWLDDWFDDHPDMGGGGGGSLTAGANIAIETDTVHFEVVFTEPGSPRIGQLWFDAGA